MGKIARRRFLEMGVASGATLVGCGPSLEGAHSPTVEKLRGRIQHFVVLMMENRSYDQMLGALPGEKYAGPPAGARLAFVDPEGHRRSVPLLRGAPRDQFYPDPPHRFPAVSRQIYGAGPHAAADMGGFAQTFVEARPTLPMAALGVQDYATIYDDGHLPILQTLAKEYGVCTHWFSSLPGSTNPNRMFAHAGTSCGATGQAVIYTRLGGKMIFDVLGNDPWLWRVYYHDAPHLWLTGDLWAKMFAGQQCRIGRFARDVRNDELPVYSFIEPRHVLPPCNSQHPFMGVSHGEALIARVYNELIANPRVFEKTLLLVVYDEHGGFYDHVIPPGHSGWNAHAPGVEHRVVAPSAPSPEGYAFDSLGVRVPAVVISPWIERGSVFGWAAEEPNARHTFDHTSILSTVGTLTGRWVESPRARAATPLDVVLNRNSPRTDASQLTYASGIYRPSPFATEAAGVGKDLQDAWTAAHGEPTTPEQLVAYYEALVQ